MHVGGVLVFDGAIARDEVVRRLRERIHLIPHYAMRLDEAPLGIANPVWREVPEFDPDRHIWRLGLPAPGGDAELCELVGHLMSERLDRTRPLWQLYLVEGLAGGRTALVAKMHHALVDGIAAVDVSTVVLDPSPEPLDFGAPDPDGGVAASARGPGRGRMDPRAAFDRTRAAADRVETLARVTAARLHVPRKLARDMASRALALDPRATARQMRDAAGVVGELARIRPAAPETRLNQTIGPDRLFALARGRLDDVKAVRNATGATVNDVLLTTVALMLEEFLAPGPPDTVVALVPVSIRSENERGELGNRISTVFVDLPLTGDPLERLAAVSAEMDEVKASAQVHAGALIVGATGLAPPLVSSLAVRAMSGPRMFNLVVSNVPGPQQTFYLAGVPMREVYPAVPLNPRNQAVTVGILSYDGGVYFGLLADRDSVPDVTAAAGGLERALGRLVGASR